MENIKVSVLCLAYNHEKYIRDALEGFVNQKTNFKYEVLINDDASTDNTAQIIKEYAERYPNIIVPLLQERNLCSQGINIINEVLSTVAKGEYIAVCEGDDYWIDNNKLQLQVDFLDSNEEYSAAVHNTYLYNCKTNEKTLMYSEENKTLGLKDVIFEGGQSFHTSSVMVRKEIYFNKTSFFDKAKGCGDYQRAINFSLFGSIYYMKQPMSVYRLFSCNTSWSTKISQRDYMLKHFRGVIEMLKEVKKCVDDSQQKLVNDAMVKYEYVILEANNDYKQLIQEPYKKIYDTKNIKYKLKAFIKRRLQK